MTTETHSPADALDYDVIVIGSGFGGSTAALRLTEKGYRVAVLEAGRRFADAALPKTSWDLSAFLWAPPLGCFGIQRMTLLKDVMVLSGAGVGGGSLVYGNTLYEPPDHFYSDRQWQHITDWRDELAPFYDQARRMLGVVDNPVTTPVDEVMRSVADDLGVGATFRPTPVGVFFGKPGVEADDPYFGGVGPRRLGCIQCGECLSGCRHGAKNTLLKNYLYLAERGGAVVHPMTTVTTVRPLADGRYAVDTVRSGTRRRGRRTFVAGDVVFAAGTVGTQKLLHRMRDAAHLPRLSPRLGELTRTNSEAILAARAFRRDVDFTPGLAVTSSFFPDAHTHVEGLRYGHGSNAMGLMATALVDGDRRPRWLAWIAANLRSLGTTLRNTSLRHWSEQTIVTLVMQTRDNSITCYTKRGLFGRRLTSKQGHGEPNPAWIPIGHEAVRRIAARIGGHAVRCVEQRLQHPAHGAFSRRRGHRRFSGVWRDRSLPPRLRSCRPARRRRRGGVVEPRRQPVVDHHRAGGAGDGHVAEPGPARRAPAARRSLRARDADCPGGADRAGERAGRAQVLTRVVRSVRPASASRAAP